MDMETSAARRMQGAVVFHTRWGNCGEVAEAIARGLQDTGHEVAMINVKKAKELDPALDFLVAGSGTRMGKMTGPLKRFLKHNLKKGWRGKPFAAFGTGMKTCGIKGRGSPHRLFGISWKEWD